MIRITLTSILLLLFAACSPLKEQSDISDLLIVRELRCALYADCSEIDLGAVRETLVAGNLHTCYLHPSGNVYCWGPGTGGRTGQGSEQLIGDNEPASVNKAVSLPARAVRLSLSASHACAVLYNGELYCWGIGMDGRLGYGSQSNIGDNETPFQAGPVPAGMKVMEVSAGDTHTCAISPDSRVRCWGDAAGGRLGHGNLNSILKPMDFPDVPLNGSFSRIHSGIHNCIVTTDQTVRCWGSGFSGRLGYANSDSIGDDEPADSAGIVSLTNTVALLSAGSSHNCALLSDQSISCWGNGGNGRLGYANTNHIGDNELPSAAGAVATGGSAIHVSAGFQHSCAVLLDSSIRCWGSGGKGRLGYGNTDDIGDDELPSSTGTVALLGNAIQVAAGGKHTCALLEAQEIQCWGQSNSGQLGYGNTNDIGDNEPANAGGIVNYR